MFLIRRHLLLIVPSPLSTTPNYVGQLKEASANHALFAFALDRPQGFIICDLRRCHDCESADPLRARRAGPSSLPASDNFQLWQYVRYLLTSDNSHRDAQSTLKYQYLPLHRKAPIESPDPSLWTPRPHAPLRKQKATAKSCLDRCVFPE